VSRHWVIVDSDGKREEVRGKGVVGDFPKLALGESYSYVSYCPIATTWGTMEGSYTFERDDGTRFQVGIGRFFLVPTAPPLPLAAQSH
jgi:ApaG protein